MIDKIINSVSDTLGLGGSSGPRRKKKGLSMKQQLVFLKKQVGGLRKRVKRASYKKVSRRRYF